MLARLDTAGAEADAAAGREPRPLEVGVFARFSRRIELGSANTVAVFPRNPRSLFTQYANLRHGCGTMVAYGGRGRNAAHSLAAIKKLCPSTFFS